jgi:hypothetical protein
VPTDTGATFRLTIPPLTKEDPAEG